ncbi:MAG: hemin uptake protein HemP [Planctomycetota bacterium]|nr:hemin uptake protein HemP [Planctomycetota bacterium]
MRELEKTSEGSTNGSSRTSGAEPLRVIPSSELFSAEARRVVIRHNGRDYLLLATRQGKLLLNLK